MIKFFNKLKHFSHPPFKQLCYCQFSPFSDYSRNEYLKKLLSEIENTPSQRAQIKYEEPFVI